MKTQKLLKITSILLTFIIASTLTQEECKPAQDHCKYCSKSQRCTTCEKSYFLDILDNAKCINCPSQCRSCDEEGCTACEIEFYREEKKAGGSKIQYCLPCSDECEGCSTRADFCTSCREYYELDSIEGTCQFKYGRLIVFGVILIAILLMVMIFLIVKCICFEKTPERPEFGSILDKDPDLLSDHLKVDMKTIGVNSKYSRQDESILSNVQPNDDSYLDLSRVSQDPFIGQLLGPRSDVLLGGEMDGEEPTDRDDINNRLKKIGDKRRVNTGL